MQFDSNNKVIQLCAKGMEMETNQKPDEAQTFFCKHGMKQVMTLKSLLQLTMFARYQKSVQDKLKWDEIALAFTLRINDNSITANYPSLYLNVAKCYQDLKDFDSAQKNYQIALSYADKMGMNTKDR